MNNPKTRLTPEDFAALRRERERLKELHQEDYRWLRDLLARHDPVHLIAVGAPNDEYEPEVDTLLPRLLELRRTGSATEPEVLQAVHAEFIKWFGAKTAGSADRYRSSAAEIHAGLDEHFVLDGVDDSTTQG